MIEQSWNSANHDRVRDAASVPELSGNWLRAARAAWIMLAILAVAVLVTALPGYAQSFRGELAHIGAQDRSLGITIIAVLSTVASLAAALLSLILATLFFRSRFTEPLAAALSYFLLLYAVVMAGPLETWSAYWLGDTVVVMRLQGLLIAIPSVALLALFPNGRFVPPWTRWLVILAVPLAVAMVFVPFPGAAELGGPGSILIIAVAAGLVGLLIAGLAAQVYRFRRVSSVTERQQAKWVVYGFALWLGYILLSTGPFFYLESLPPGAPAPWWAAISVLGWFLALNIVPLSLTISVTRYRLWDIDLVINRTLVYGALTAFVIAIYALVVGGAGALFQAQGNWLLTLIATGLVAVLFQPVHIRLQRAVNRLLYGHRDEPLEVMARLGQRLEDALAPEQVLPTLVETIAQTLKLPYAAITTGPGEAQQMAVSYGKPAANARSFPLIYQGATIGFLLAAPRSPGESFTPAEEQLLQNAARQAGTAVHALQLTADLQHARQQVVASREEERRRLRRDLHDGMGPSLAAQLLKLGSARALLADRPELTDRLLAEMESDIEGTLAEVRRIVYDLRPPALDQWGLAGALRAYAETCESGALSVRVDAPDTLPPLPAAVEVAAYHIGREAMANVVRHAQARRCTLRLWVEGETTGCLHLAVHDDGQGIAGAPRAGVGLTAMRERAEELGGTCAVAGEPGKGTQVTAVLPLVSSKEARATHVQ
ncbi:MAG: GAF domain-containing sensor histidine kinase [Caldilineales bacterium]